VPERVVHDLEVVQIEEEDGDELVRVADGSRQRVVEPLDEQGAVRQAGQAVIEGLVGEAFLELLAIGDVDHHAAHLRVAAPITGDEHGLVPDPDDIVGAGGHAVFPRGRFLHRPRAELFLGRQHKLAVSRVHLACPEPGISQPLGRGEPEHGLDLRADVAPRSLRSEVGHVDDRGQSLDQGPIALLGVADLALRIEPVADVADVRREDRVAREIDGRDRELDGEGRAVGTHRLDLDATP